VLPCGWKGAQYRHCKFERKLAKIESCHFIFENMGWDNLKVFLAVAAAGGLGGGARRLGVSQATVWRRIKALEDSLQTPLFERRAEGYALGAAGSALLRSLEGVQRSIARRASSARPRPASRSRRCSRSRSMSTPRRPT
jgi:molybdate transport repressor ModE-like protein